MQLKDLIIILLSWFLGNMSIHFITPSLPTLVETYHSNTQLIELIISLFLAGKAIGILFWGILSEKIGRRPIFFLGLILYGLTNWLALIQGSIFFLLFCRLGQGFAVGATLLMGRCMINDAHDEKAAIRRFSFLFTGAGIIICFLPWIGSLLNAQYGFQASFFVMGLYGFVLMALSRIKETKIRPLSKLASEREVGEDAEHKPGIYTQVHEDSSTVSTRQFSAEVARERPIKNTMSQDSIWTIIKHPAFLGYLLITGFMTGGESTFNTSGSFILIQEAGWSINDFGKVKTLMTFMYLFGAGTSGFLVRKIQTTSIINGGVFLSILATGWMWICALFDSSIMVGFIVPMMAYYYGSGLIISCLSSLIVRPFPKQMGLAMAVSLFFQYILSASFSFVCSLMGIHTIGSFIIIITFTSLMGGLCLKGLCEPSPGCLRPLLMKKGNTTS